MYEFCEAIHTARRTGQQENESHAGTGEFADNIVIAKNCLCRTEKLDKSCGYDDDGRQDHLRTKGVKGIYNG
jgi:hypothetical protein